MPTEREFPSISVEKGGRELFNMEIVRGDKIEVRIKTSQEIEGFFKSMSSGKKESTKWLFADGSTPHYYEWKGDSQDSLTDTFMSSYLNMYGGKFFDGERANIAILRTVGISDGIIIVFDGMMTKETLQAFSEQIRDFVVKLYKQFIRRIRLRVNISVDEVM